MPIQRRPPEIRARRLGPRGYEHQKAVPIFWSRSRGDVDRELLLGQVDRLFLQRFALVRECLSSPGEGQGRQRATCHFLSAGQRRVSGEDQVLLLRGAKWHAGLLGATA